MCHSLTCIISSHFKLALHVIATSTHLTQTRKKIFELGGANGIRTITHLLRRMDSNGNGCLDRTELYEGLKAFGLTDLTCTPGGDMVR
jgi:hypothetical protein